MVHQSIFYALMVFILIQVCFSGLNMVSSSLVNVSRQEIKKGSESFGTIILPLKGNVYPIGHYLVSLEIGNPGKTYDFDIDSGSVLTWIQCDAPCRRCTLPRDQLYKPQGNLVPCGNAMCTALSSDQKQPCRNPKDQCDYHVQYADHGSSMGVLVHDKFSIQLSKGNLISPDIAFGCGYDQQNPTPNSPPPPAGVLGLGNSRFGIVSQLKALGLTRNVVGHCLGRQDGALFFGDGLLRTPKLTWVPMSRNSEVYSSGPAEVYYSGKPTGIKGLNVVFDSGSTYTYFNQQAYQAVFNRIKSDLAGKPIENAPEDKTLDICWKGKGGKQFKSIDEVKTHFKPLSLIFTEAKKTRLDLPPESYLIVNKKGNVCLGILQSSRQIGNVNIIGDISMQDKIVLYDNEKRQVGWTAAKCKPPPKQSSHKSEGSVVAFGIAISSIASIGHVLLMFL